MDCRNGYYLNNRKECIPCKYPCDICTDYSTCSTCIDTLYLDGTECKECISGCKKCSDGTTCTTCIDGYYLDPDICKEC